MWKYRKITNTLCLYGLFLLTSCDLMIPKPATEEQKRQAMDNAVFDKTIISGISKYDSLKNFLFFYGDTIISYRNSKSYVIEVSGGGKTDTVLSKENCYHFQTDYDFSKLPAFLKPKLDSIYKTIGEGNIESFDVCTNKEITIEVRLEGGENGLYISHNLMWNAKMERDYTYSNNKDTMITRGCIYRIGMTENHGH